MKKLLLITLTLSAHLSQACLQTVKSRTLHDIQQVVEDKVLDVFVGDMLLMHAYAPIYDRVEVIAESTNENVAVLVLKNTAFDEGQTSNIDIAGAPTPYNLYFRVIGKGNTTLKVKVLVRGQVVESFIKKISAEYPVEVKSCGIR